MVGLMAIWGVSFSVVKALIDLGVEALPLIALRFWIATLLLLPLLRPGDRRTGPMLGTMLRPGILAGIVLFLGYALQTYGVQATSASLAGFLTGLIVLIVAVAGWLFFGEPVRRGPALGVAFGIVGVVALSLGHENRDENTMRGTLLLLGSTVSYAMHVILISRWSRRGGEVAFTMWQLATVAVLTSALMTVVPSSGTTTENLYGLQAWLLIGYLAELATAFAIDVQSRVQPRIAPSRVATLFATHSPAAPGSASASGHGSGSAARWSPAPCW